MKATDLRPAARSDRRGRVVRRLAAIAIAAILTLALVPALAGADAASPKPGHKATAEPRTVNVRALARAERLPGYVHPTRKPTPVQRVKKSSRVARTPSTNRSGPTWVGPRPRTVALWPGFDQKVAFAGLADGAKPGTGPAIDPPDPWVAAGPNHVVQAVNTTLRFSTRDGALLSEVSLAAFFGEPTGESGDGDSRVLYDAAHQRWVASELSFDCATGHVRLAVSDTSDPTADWHVWDFAFSGSLPDYPGLGLSADKIVFTANHFALSACSFGAFSGATAYVIDWAAVLGGGVLPYTPSTPVANASTWRPAMNLTSDRTVHLVAQGPANEVLYGEITGTNAGADIAVTTSDLSGAGVPDFADPPIPQDPFGPLGPAAVDARPTDAIWQGGHLWFVSTYPYSFDLGATYHDTVRITELDTTGAVSLLQDMLLGGDGFDAYMGGVGLSQVGGLYAVYTESGSSPSAYASSVAAFRSPLSPPNEIDGFRALAQGQGGYNGTRWGDYVGVATDPVDPYAVWQADEYANSDHAWSTHVSMLSEDRTPPRTALVGPVVTVPGVVGTTTIASRVTWSGLDDFTGIASYELQQSVAGSAWAGVALPIPLTTSISPTLTIGTAYRFRARATDRAGNIGPWATSSIVKPYLYQQTSGTVYSGTWSSSSSSVYSGGSVRYASTAGRYATFTTTGARSIAIVTSKGKTRGSFKVYVDNLYKGTISTYSTTTKYRQLVYQYSWSTPGTHKVKIYIVGTRGHPRVDVDAFVVLR